MLKVSAGSVVHENPVTLYKRASYVQCKRDRLV